MPTSANAISECVTVVCMHYTCDQCTVRINTSECEVCAGSARCCAHGEVELAAQHVSLSHSRSNTLNALPPCVIGISDVCGEFVTVYLLMVTVVRYIPCHEDLLLVCCFTEVWFLSPDALLCAVHEVMPISWTFFVTFDFPVS